MTAETHVVQGCSQSPQLRTRIVLGNDILHELQQRQYEDEPDPFQSDIDFDEEAQVRNTLESVFDEAPSTACQRKITGHDTMN